MKLMEDKNVKEISEAFTKKQLIKLLDSTIKHNTSLVKYLYDNHRAILREWEKTQGNLRIEFAGEKDGSKSN